VRHVDTTRVEELLPHLGDGNKCVEHWCHSMSLMCSVSRWFSSNHPPTPS
jgi:hypothetical protein